MTIQQKVLAAGLLLTIGTMTGPGARHPVTAPPAAAIRTLPIEVHVPLLGFSWTGSISLDHRGLIVSSDPGLQWEQPSPGDGSPDLVTAARRCLRFVGSLVDLPAPLARAALPLAAPGR